MNILEGLNKNQQEAVQYGDGPLLIFAGAGSGKTRVLTHRIAYLIEERGVDPHQILAVTFTNKAAGEMKERIGKLVPYRARNIWVGTFHAICSRLLRMEGDKIGIDPDFVVYDDSDQLTLIKECLTQLNLDEKQYPPRNVLSLISRAKEELIDPRNFDQHFQGFFEAKVSKIYSIYQEKLRQNKALDFDDLIMLAVKLLQKCEDVRSHYQERFRYILVDEYQDINYSQYIFVKTLAALHQNLCVVGDDDQSIYAWRGADVKLIRQFSKDYPKAGRVILDQNYRSTQNILEAAHCIVKRNKTRTEKKLWTENPEGNLIHLFEASDEHDEAVYVYSMVNALVQKGERHYSDFAVLYRTNAQSRVLEDVFLNFGIPYRIIGGLRFYERKEIKDIIAYLRVIHNPNDSVSLRRIINVPARKIGTVSWNHLVEHAVANEISVFESLKQAKDIGGSLKRCVPAIEAFVKLIEDLHAREETINLTDLVREAFSRSGYEAELAKEQTPESRTRLENIQEFMSVTKEFEQTAEEPTLNNFLEQIALVSDVDSLTEENDSVTLMTLHSAKGLEFPVVFMIGMEEGIFPHARALREDGQLEEERRLAYVGVTRAKEDLTLTYALRRTLFGQHQRNAVSRFLKDIPKELTDQGISTHTGQSRLWDDYDINQRPTPYGETPGISRQNPTPYGGSFTGQTTVNPTPYTKSAGGPHPTPYQRAAESLQPAAQSVSEAMRKAKEIISRAGGIKSAAANGYYVGQKVIHPIFGTGIVVGLKGDSDSGEITVAFDAHGVKRLMLAYAKLTKVED